MVWISSFPENGPAAGDIILRSTHDGSRACTLGPFGEAPQITCATYEEAIAQAEKFARSHGVDVWRTDDGRAFSRLIECRVISAT
jgi:hypothetical protein